MSLVRKSGCKINLLLNILGKRDDGFHELETVMQPVPLFDELHFDRVGDRVEMSSSHPHLPCDQTNLVVKAASSFQEATGICEGVRIHLEKNIPMEAGLGGGSSNAATTLLAVNELFDSPISAKELSDIAASLGSDVPFFLQSGPALATGRGEKIQPLEPFFQIDKLSLLLVHPGFGISTGWSYRTLANFPDGISGRPGRGTELIEAIRTDEGDWGSKLYNSLELPAFHKYPVLELYVEFFKERHAQASLMSGSGSTVYAYFETPGEAERALDEFKSEFGDVGWSTIVSPHADG